MSAPPKITCLFFSDLTVSAFLNTPVGRPFAGELLVECGSRPALTFLLNVETPAHYPGIAGLLGGLDLGSLAHPSELLPAPVLLAAPTPVSPAALRSALARLRRPDPRLNAITLLVPLADAPALGAALALADRFVIAWDAGAHPHEELLDFARWCAAEKLFTAENFAGLFPYTAEPLAPAHAARLGSLLAPFATLSSKIRGEIVPAFI